MSKNNNHTHLPEAAVASITAIMNEPQVVASTPTAKNTLVAVCEKVLLNLDINPTLSEQVHQLTPTGNPHKIITAIAEASNCQMRCITLENKWWNKDSGPLIVF